VQLNNLHLLAVVSGGPPPSASPSPRGMNAPSRSRDLPRRRRSRRGGVVEEAGLNSDPSAR